LSIEPLDSNEPGYYSYNNTLKKLILSCLFLLLDRYQSSQVDVKTTEAPGKMKKKSRARNKNYHNFGTK
jgi:hypothetical protein